MTDYTVARDYWGRPYVTTDGKPLQYVEGRKTPINAEPYTRISTMAGAMDDKGGLVDWASAKAMMGVVSSESIYAQVANLMSNHADPWAERKTPLKELVKKAQEAGGSEDASGLGTAFHGLTEVVDSGAWPNYVPRQLEPWLDAYREAMLPWSSVLIEPFVVCDELKTAGSPDRYLLSRETGEIYAADIKSGTNEPAFPDKVATQVAIAAHAQLYTQQTGERQPIICNQERGILIHAPIRGGGMPQVDLYWLDLTKGWESARLAYQVRNRPKLGKLEKIA